MTHRGLIETPMLAQLKDNPPPEGTSSHKRRTELERVPLGRLAQPEEVGKLIAYLLSEDASYVNGEVVRIDAGLLS